MSLFSKVKLEMEQEEEFNPRESRLVANNLINSTRSMLHDIKNDKEDSTSRALQ